MDAELPQPCDESVIRLARNEPRTAWGQETRCHAWKPGRWLPSERASLLQLECLGVWNGLKVLQTEAGTGWMSSLLLGLGARLCATEPDSSCHRDLSRRMPREVPLCRAHGRDGWPQAAPFDRILPSEILREEPLALRSQLAPGGRIVYWLLGTEGLELRLEVLEERGVVGERLALVGPEGCPQELRAFPGP